MRTFWLLAMLLVATEARAGIRYDGLYCFRPKDDPRMTYVLRFYPDGEVIRMLAIERPVDIARWIHRHRVGEPIHPYDPPHGPYVVKGASICYSVANSVEKFSECGEIGSGYIVFPWRNASSGRRGTERYDFMRFDLPK